MLRSVRLAVTSYERVLSADMTKLFSLIFPTTEKISFLKTAEYKPLLQRAMASQISNDNLRRNLQAQELEAVNVLTRSKDPYKQAGTSDNPMKREGNDQESTTKVARS